jgi:hypothetical protein
VAFCVANVDKKTFLIHAKNTPRIPHLFFPRRAETNPPKTMVGGFGGSYMMLAQSR